MVRIKWLLQHLEAKNKAFSIPLWFDKKTYSVKKGHNFKVFQFLYGSIKMPFSDGLKRSFERFNSTMVRLKFNQESVAINGAKEFQFHYGSIKICVDVAISVRYLQVSIPLWFD